jgi:hypothetical protein
VSCADWLGVCALPPPVLIHDDALCVLAAYSIHTLLRSTRAAAQARRQGGRLKAERLVCVCQSIDRSTDQSQVNKMKTGSAPENQDTQQQGKIAHTHTPTLFGARLSEKTIWP